MRRGIIVGLLMLSLLVGVSTSWAGGRYRPHHSHESVYWWALGLGAGLGVLGALAHPRYPGYPVYPAHPLGTYPPVAMLPPGHAFSCTYPAGY
jgi:hypothetical protein